MDRDAVGDAVSGADRGAQRRGSGSEVAGGRSRVGHVDRSGLAHEVPQGAQGSPLQSRPRGSQADGRVARPGQRARVPRNPGEDGRGGGVQPAADRPEDRLQPARVPQFVPVLVLRRGIDREVAEQALANAVGANQTRTAMEHPRHQGRPSHRLRTVALKPPEVPHLAGRDAAGLGRTGAAVRESLCGAISLGGRFEGGTAGPSSLAPRAERAQRRVARGVR